MNEVKAEEEIVRGSSRRTPVGRVRRRAPGQARPAGPVGGRPPGQLAHVRSRLAFGREPRQRTPVRVVRALRELGIEAVAVSTADRDARRPPCRPRDPSAAVTAESYLNIASIVAAAGDRLRRRHPGYGFLSSGRPSSRPAWQRPRLRRPGREVMAQMGDRSRRRRRCARPRPLVPGTEQATTLDQATKLAPELGFQSSSRPLRGRPRIASSSAELEDAYTRPRARRRQRSATGHLPGEGRRPRGTSRSSARRRQRRRAHARGARVLDQRRHQKLIESPSARSAGGARDGDRPRRACRRPATERRHARFLLGPDGGFSLHPELNAASRSSTRSASSSPGSTSSTSSCGSRPGVLRLTGRAPRQGTRQCGSARRTQPAASRRHRAGSSDCIPAGLVCGWTPVEAARRSPELRLADREALRLGRDRPAAIARALRALGELELEGTRRAISRCRCCAEAFTGDYNVVHRQHGALAGRAPRSSCSTSGT